MLGPPKLRLLDRPVAASLEDLVPADNFSRFLDAKLDLSFVRTWVHDCYADHGRPSIDPVVFFKLQLILFFEGLRSERKLMDTVALNLAHRWYLGYHLDEALPDHSSLTRIRARLGLPLFERFFAHVVELCQQAGLVWGAELFFDGTKVRANADIDSLVPRWYVAAKAHLQTLFADAAPQPHRRTPPQPRRRSRPSRLHRCDCHVPGPRRRSGTLRRPMTPRGGCWTSTGWTPTGHPPAPIGASPTSG